MRGLLVGQFSSVDARTLPGARLVVTRGVDKGKSINLGKEEIVVGTSAAADLQLTAADVSGCHFSIQVRSEGFLLTDLDSAGGTLVDGRVIRSMYIRPGDAIEIGTTKLRLRPRDEGVTLPLSSAEAFGGYLGRSVAARRTFTLLEQVAPTNTTVLLLGESGTGKDVVAESIHERSPRADGRFVVFDCGSVADGVLESELFGHEPGAFTGATHRRLGVFQEAQGGTLFLDEIGELPKDLQPKLLRALDRREVRPIGAESPIPVDVRIIAATNRDLRRDVNHGTFREDLFYRLNVFPITLPPLRERPEDLVLLATSFWRELTGEREAQLPKDFVPLLLAHTWPGNVRELRNRLERAALLDEPNIVITNAQVSGEISFSEAKLRATNEFERVFLTALMARAENNVSEAARRASMDRVHLSRLLRKHSIR
jgi:transcriptional regulator with GAF, ATPase, and Fis domain